MPFPYTPLPLYVEAAFGADPTADPVTWLWTDLSSRLIGQPISRTFGQRGGAAQASAGSLVVTLANDDGHLSPLNPLSQYYPNVALGLPIRLRFDRLTIKTIADTFSRTVTEGWGSTPSGEVWATGAGGGVISPTDTSVGSGVGVHSIPASNAARINYLPTAIFGDVDVTVSFTVGVTATGAPIEPCNIAIHGITGSASQYALARVTLETSNSVTATLFSGGGNQTSATTGITHVAGQTLTVRAQSHNGQLRMKVWRTADPEPGSWLAAISDEAAPRGYIGIRSGVAAGNTNTKPVVITVDNLTITEPPTLIQAAGFADSWQQILAPIPGNTSQMSSAVKITASGALRRLGQGTPPLRSPIYREITKPDNASLMVAYWPAEDGNDARQITSGTGAHIAMTTTGEVDLASYSGIPGSDPLPTLRSGASIHSNIPNHPDGATYTRSVWYLPDTTPDGAILVDLRTTGTGGRWVLVYGTGGTLRLRLFSTVTGSLVAESGLGSHLIGGQRFLLSLELTQNGGNVDAIIFTRRILDNNTAPDSATSLQTHTFTSVTFGRDIRIIIGPSGNLDGTAIGHIGIGSTQAFAFGLTGAITGNNLETAAARFIRICREEAIPCQTYNSVIASAQMGVQRPGQLLDILRECAAADGGLFAESNNHGLSYRTRAARYTPPVAMTIDMSTYRTGRGDATNVVAPIYDDLEVRNYFTATRTDGSSDIYTDPDSVARSGFHDDGATVNVAYDDQLRDYAAWQVHLGTVDQNRYPSVPIDLAANPDLITAWLNTLLGDRIVRTNIASGYLPSGSIDQVIEGYAETLSPNGWQISAICAPAAPWNVGLLDDPGVGRLGADGSTLWTAISSSATTWQVRPGVARWTTAAADFSPSQMEVVAGGEVARVSGIADAASFVAAGTAAHADNASVTPGLPAGLQSGDLMVMHAAIRNSGVGTPNSVTGWTSLLFGNTRLYAKVAGSSESAPTVTFTGGAAGDTTSAQICAFRGVAYDSALTFTQNLVASNTGQLNGSAQNIAFQPLAVATDNQVLLLVAWKQDDWTSVAPPAGWTEIGEPSSTTGNDQGLWWGYQIQTSAAGIRKESITVTGGGSAISRSRIIALQGLQTFTISARSVNGVIKAQTAGTEMHVNNPIVLAR